MAKANTASSTNSTASGTASASGAGSSSKLTDAQIVAALNSTATPVLQPLTAPWVSSNPALGTVPVIAQFNPRAVGLLRKIFVRVEVDFTVAADTSISRSPFGPAALISSVQFTDLNNNKRHDTTGYHLAWLSSVKARQPAGSAFMTDTALGFGNNVGGGIAYPLPTTGTAGTYTAMMTYEVPIAYADGDYRGAMYLGTTQATATLQLQVNPLLFAPTSNADNVESAYQYSGTAPVVSQVRIHTFQDYLDQLPMLNGSVLLPSASMSTIYQLIRADQSGVVANSDFRLDFANLRTYMSRTVIFDNGGQLNPGTDVDQIRIDAANLYQFRNTDPLMMSYQTRMAIGDDMPRGAYYFSLRQRPINTAVYGNTGLVFKANTVNSNAKFIDLQEFFSDTLTMSSQSISG